MKIIVVTKASYYENKNNSSDKMYRLALLLAVLSSVKAPLPMLQNRGPEGWNWVNQRAELNDAVQDVLRSRMKKVTTELRDSQRFTNYLIESLQHADAPTFDSRIHYLNRLYNDIYDMCNQTTDSMWQLCYSEFKEICYAEAHHSCPNLNKTEIQQLMQTEFDHHKAPMLFSPFQLRVDDQKIFFRLNSTERSRISESLHIEQILSELINHVQSINRLETSLEDQVQGPHSQGLWHQIEERASQFMNRSKRNARPAIVPKRTFFNKPSNRVPVSADEEQGPITKAIQNLSNNKQRKVTVKEATKSNVHFQKNSVARKINFFTSIKIDWQAVKAKLEKIFNITEKPNPYSKYIPHIPGNRSYRRQKRSVLGNHQQENPLPNLQSGKNAAFNATYNTTSEMNTTRKETTNVTLSTLPRFQPSRFFTPEYFPSSSSSQFHGTVTDESGTHQFTDQAAYNEYLRTSQLQKQIKSVNKIIKDLEHRLQHWKTVKANLQSGQHQNVQSFTFPHFSLMNQNPFFSSLPNYQVQEVRPAQIQLPTINFQPHPNFHYGNAQTYNQQSSQGYYPNTYTTRTRSQHFGPWTTTTRQWGNNFSPFSQRRISSRRAKRQASDSVPVLDTCNVKLVMESCTDLISRREYCSNNIQHACSRVTVERRKFLLLLSKIVQSVRDIVQDIGKLINKYAWYTDISNNLSMQIVSFQPIGQDTDSFEVRASIFGSPNFTMTVTGFHNISENIVSQAIKTYKENINV